MCKKTGILFMLFAALCLTLGSFNPGLAQAAKNDARHKAAKETVTPSTLPAASPVAGQPQKKAAPNYQIGEGVTMIGDSIMSGNMDIILDQMPKALIDAKGSRDVCGGFEAAQRLQQAGELSDVVIVELGTNGPLLEHEPYATGTQNLLRLLGDKRQIFWVTVYCSYSEWMRMNNNYIHMLAKTRPNITVIDWYSLAVAHPDWFPDGVHPNMEGARQFAKLLRDSMAKKYGANDTAPKTESTAPKTESKEPKKK